MGESIDLSPEITGQIDEIRQDKIHGASWLSRQALKVINLAVERSEATEPARLMGELKEVGKELGESKPSMASITNSVARFVYEVYRKSEVQEDMTLLKRLARSIGDELIRDSEEAFREVTEQGAGMVGMTDRLMTCSYSSTVCQALKIAGFGGKNFSVLVAESGFGGRAYGEVTASELRSYGIEAEIIPDSAIVDRMSKVDKVLVGADSLLADGSLVNGVPTYAIARAAKESQVPFYSLCETAKFDARSYLGRSEELEDGFEKVSPHLIAGIITEQGMLKSNEVVNYIKEMAGYVRFLFQS